MPKRSASQIEASQALASLIVKRAKTKSAKRGMRYGQSRADAQRQSKRLLLPVIRNPLPKTYKTTVTYPPAAFPLTGAGGVGTEIAVQVGLNDVYAFDHNAVLGNIQPLYLDSLLSSTGPYKKFKVTGWRCKITIDNTTQFGSANSRGLDCIVGQGYLSLGDCDTFSELSSLPNTQRKMVQWYGAGPMARAVFEMNGTTKQFAGPQADSIDQCGYYNASPAALIYGAIAVKCPDGTTVPSMNLQVHCEMDVIFYSDDGVQS